MGSEMHHSHLISGLVRRLGMAFFLARNVENRVCKPMEKMKHPVGTGIMGDDKGLCRDQPEYCQVIFERV